MKRAVQKNPYATRTMSNSRARKRVSLSPSVNPDSDEVSTGSLSNASDEETADTTDWEVSMKKIITVDLWSDDEVILDNGICYLVENMNKEAGELAKKQKLFFQMGGHLVIVKTLERHIDNQLMQQNGISVLMNSSYTEHLRRPEEEMQLTVLAQVKAMEAILVAMKKYESSSDIQIKGLSALINLTLHHKSNTNLFATELNGIPLVLKNMKQFPLNEDVIKQACDLLGILAGHKRFQKLLLDANAGSSLMAAFEGHKDKEEIHESARVALNKLTHYPS